MPSPIVTNDCCGPSCRCPPGVPLDGARKVTDGCSKALLPRLTHIVMPLLMIPRLIIRDSTALVVCGHALRQNMRWDYVRDQVNYHTQMSFIERFLG